MYVGKWMGSRTNAFDVHGRMDEISGCSHLVIFPDFCMCTMICNDTKVLCIGYLNGLQNTINCIGMGNICDSRVQTNRIFRESSNYKVPFNSRL
jgi:hypothetical protein